MARNDWARRVDSDPVRASNSDSKEEQGEALLQKSSDPSTGIYRKDSYDESTCCVLRWWHLIVLLLVCTFSVPAAVRLVNRGFPSSGVESQTNGHVTSGIDSQFKSGDLLLAQKDDPVRYVLDPSWDIDAPPTIREFTWTLTEKVYNPDGVFRLMLVINDEFPGPLIRANEGDTIRVHVINQMSNSTAIHWHGIYQNGTNWMDGTVGISQCPIAPGHNFTYEFTVDNQSGTYWYHAHQGVQSSDGLHGPLIIHSWKEKELQQIQYATDRVVMLSDHYHDLSSVLARAYMAPDMENTEPVPDGALINGHAVRNCDELPHRKCDNSTANVQPPFFALDAGKHHRLRIINVGAFAEFQFQIDEHELAVTEADGTDVVPVYYHRLNINPAQRYSVIVHANSTRRNRFRMRARMITTCFAEPNPFMAGEVHGIVLYSTPSTAAQDPTLPDSKDWNDVQALECRDLNTTELVPVEAIPAPAQADAFFYLRANFEIGAHQLSRGFFNSSSWRPDVHSPTLARAHDGLQAANASFSPTSTGNNAETPVAWANSLAFPTDLVIQTTRRQTLDILISNFDDGNHPMHLHGYKYFVLAQGHGYPPRLSVFDPLTPSNLAPLYASLDLSNPLRRDTASVEAFGWILLRFVADNPGVWPLHCHISWHTEAGLLMQFLTLSEGVKGFEVPVANRALCRAEGLERGMGMRDEDYY